MARPSVPTDTLPLETLRTLLDSASRLLAELADDPLLARLTRVYADLPTGDREPIVAILEREVQARLTADVAGDVTGLALRPNPSARLYTRILAGDPRPNPERAVQQALRAIRVTHGAVAPMDSEWKTIARAALAEASAEERASMERFARELFGLVEECRARLDPPEGTR
jgi:hypothetical protein